MVNFYVMGVGIYDENAHEMNTTSYGEPGVPLEAPRFAPGVALAVDDAMNFDRSQHATEALRASEEGFRLIVDSIPAFAWYARTDGRIEYLNQRIPDFTGVRLEDLVGFGWANSPCLKSKIIFT